MPFMSHEKRIVLCTCPQDPHAFDGISVQPRAGELDVRCPECLGHGQWNIELDLASQRSKRQLCDYCDARGWLETGDDMVPTDDIIRSQEGYAQWVVRMDKPKRR